MPPSYRYVRGDVCGRQRRRLDQKFPLLGFKFADGLREHLFDLCGDRDAFGFAMGNALHRHASGIYGPVPVTDRKLNDHILDRRRERHPSGRWVVSLHRVGGELIEIATDIATGETRVRRPTAYPAAKGMAREIDS